MLGFHNSTEGKIFHSTKEIKKIIKVIKKSNNFLITSHINLEGDSLGSQLAMANLLRRLGKNFVVFEADRVSTHYQFLPDIDLVQHEVDIKKKIDVAIVLDCPNMSRTGR